MEAEAPGLCAASSMTQHDPAELPELNLAPSTTTVSSHTSLSFSISISTENFTCLASLDQKLGNFESDLDSTEVALELFGSGNTSSLFPGRPSYGDSDRDSIVSDYSEMAEPVKEHLANMHILQEAELSLSHASGYPAVGVPRHRALMQRNPGEDDAEFRRRQQRKMNFLSLAQEFAAVKSANADALPFNLHQRKSLSDVKTQDDDDEEISSLAEEFSKAVSAVGESQSSDICDSGIALSTDVSVDNCSLRSESLLEDCIPDIVRDLHDDDETTESPSAVLEPRHGGHTTVISGNSKTVHNESCAVCNGTISGGETDGNYAELQVGGAQLCRKCSDEKRLQLLRQRERENIRLRLVLGDVGDASGDDVMSASSRMASAANLASCHESSASLRMCYVNEAAFDDDDDDDINGVDADFDGNYIDKKSGFADGGNDADVGLRLRPDLIANTSMPQPQSTGFHNPFSPAPAVEAYNHRCPLTSTLPDCQVELMSWKMDRFDRLSVQQLGTGQLQVIINDQLSRIEALNVELMERLMERDDLHRTQDSLLVDLEDFSGFIRKAQSSARLADGNDD